MVGSFAPSDRVQALLASGGLSEGRSPLYRQDDHAKYLTGLEHLGLLWPAGGFSSVEIDAKRCIYGCVWRLSMPTPDDPDYVPVDKAADA